MKDKAEIKVFISYRRKGGIDTARWLHDQLKERGYEVFLDLEGLRAGAFNTALYQKIRESNVFLIVLSKNSLKRCSDKNDWVRQELSYALRCGLNIVPVIKEDFVFPKRLPADIAPLRSYNGLQIRYEFFDAFMVKLEEYILSDSGQIPPPEPDTDDVWKKYLLLGLAFVLLLVGVFFLGKGVDRTSETEASQLATETEMTQKTTEVEQTEGLTEAEQIQAPSSEVTQASTEGKESGDEQAAQPERYGNTVTNLCNRAFVASRSENKTVFLSSPDVVWYHLFAEEDISYHYDEEERFIAVSWKNDKGENLRIKLLKEVDCQYLCVTSDWLYCVLVEDGIGILYRAENKMDQHSIGELEVLVTNIFADVNGIAIYNDCIYYWIEPEGLYQCRADGSERKMVFKAGNTGCYGWKTFHVTDRYLYFCASPYGIYSISLENGELGRILDIKGQSCVISHAVESGGKIYYVVTKESDGVRTAPDELWCVNMDGTENTLLYTQENVAMETLQLNESVAALYLKVVDGSNVGIYKYSISNGDMELAYNYQ